MFTVCKSLPHKHTLYFCTNTYSYIANGCFCTCTRSQWFCFHGIATCSLQVLWINEDRTYMWVQVLWISEDKTYMYTCKYKYMYFELMRIGLKYKYFELMRIGLKYKYMYSYTHVCVLTVLKYKCQCTFPHAWLVHNIML